LGQDLSLCKEITRDIIFSSSGSLAAQTVFNLGTHNPFFLTDNQQLVNFFNGNHHSNPPRWEIKNYTQEFINHTATNNARVFKVPRKLNTTAHVLASQALSSQSMEGMQLTCSNPSHVTGCPSFAALNSVISGGITIIAASCC
jgi:hypothetical protein